MPFLFRQAAQWTLASCPYVCAALFALVPVWPHDASSGAADCAFEPADPAPIASFVRHLPRSCTQADRERLAVDASEILQALKEGKGVDLAGVVVTGDLLLDQLPLQALAGVNLQSARLQEVLRSKGISEVRIIKGPLSIRDSQVRGPIASKLKEGYLVVDGLVAVGGSTFEHSLDLSHTAFSETVQFSDSILLRDAFFVGALFVQAARFERTAFGPHTRFHRAVFMAPVSFLRAGFNGLAEFLEVTFEKEASFSRAYFKLGTGFSGSQFHQGADFSEATFEREAYFLFTHFDGDAYFRRGTFRGTTDFSDAEFKGLDDFSKAYFEEAPTFKRTKRNQEGRPLGGLQNPKILLTIVVALVVFTLTFLLVLRKM